MSTCHIVGNHMSQLNYDLSNIHTLFVPATNDLASVCIYDGSPEPSLLDNVILSCAGHFINQSELPRPIPRNSVESDHECTSRIYFITRMIK